MRGTGRKNLSAEKGECDMNEWQTCDCAAEEGGTGRVDFCATPLSQLPLVMAYVPMQRYTKVYDQEKGLCAGTIFPELDKPFCGRGICK